MTNTESPKLARVVAGSYLLYCVGLLSACGNDTPAVSGGNATEDWVLQPGQFVAAFAAAPTLQFAPGNRLLGFSGCDDFEGVYRRAGDSLYISALTVSDIGCADSDEQRDAASRYIVSLESAIGIKEADGILQVTTEDKTQPLRFVAR